MNVAMNMKTSSKRSHQQQPVILSEAKDLSVKSHYKPQLVPSCFHFRLSIVDCRLASTASRANRAQSYPRAQLDPARQASSVQYRATTHPPATEWTHHRSPE